MAHEELGAAKSDPLCWGKWTLSVFNLFCKCCATGVVAGRIGW